ncbi:unnamed protein product [Vitrella brassicaformis CCMP3155]|uniref:Uncharacterized protein n=2 Tax=Vitrella brassicaformis TaxID=1169539 RepID=A0A0G4ETL4_VITBC|nr:unnamed protein product [Vitrella brassicaformis CCMP3155]|eukprot:CEM01582.1 unnamed protein product [Vitrella brassicaformis CCMP3155]
MRPPSGGPGSAWETRSLRRSLEDIVNCVDEFSSQDLSELRERAPYLSLADARDAIAQMQRNGRRHQDVIRERDDALAELERHRPYESRCDELEGRVRELQTSLREAQEHASRQESLVEELRHSQDVTSREARARAESEQRAKEQSDHMRKELTQLRSKCCSLEAQMNLLQQEHDEAKSECAAKAEELVLEKELAEEHKQRYANLQKKLEQAPSADDRRTNDRIAELQDADRRLQEEIDRRKAEAKRYEEDRKRLTEAAKQEARAHEREMQRLREDLKQTQRQRQKDRSPSRGTRVVADQQPPHSARDRSRIAELEQENKRLQQELREARSLAGADTDAARPSHAAYAEERSRLKGSPSFPDPDRAPHSKGTDGHSGNKDTVRMEKERESLTNQVRSLKEDLDECRRRVDQEKRRNTQYQNTMQAYREGIKTLLGWKVDFERHNSSPGAATPSPRLPPPLPSPSASPVAPVPSRAIPPPQPQQYDDIGTFTLRSTTENRCTVFQMTLAKGHGSRRYALVRTDFDERGEGLEDADRIPPFMARLVLARGAR